MSLQSILNSQQQLQEKLGFNCSKMTEQEKSEYMHTHAYFLMEETTEMLRETPFHKPWKNYSEWTQNDFAVQKELAQEEAIDILHFLANIFIALDMNEEKILEMYREKNKLNHRRQEDPSLGYVGGN